MADIDSPRSRRSLRTAAAEQASGLGSPGERLRRLAALGRAGAGSPADQDRSADDLDELDEDLDSLLRPGWTPSQGRHRLESAPVPRALPWRVIVIATVLLLALSGVWVARAFAARSTPVPDRSTPVVTMSPTGASTLTPAGQPAAGGRGSGTAVTSAASLLVHVVGAVATPGVVRLTPGSRVTDAVQAAGGALPQADLGGVNLARQVADGEQIVIPTPGQSVTTAGPAAGGSAPVPGGTAAGAAGGAASAGGAVDLNSATTADLDALPGIGPVLAARIVEWREQNGPFTSVDELGEVSGIGDKLLERLRDQVRV